MIVLPAVDILGGKCVRLFQGEYGQSKVYSDSPVDQARKWIQAGARWIHLVDLDGAKAGMPVNIQAITDVCAADSSVKFEMGGGIRCLEHAHLAFKAGVERVILGTAACENPDIVRDMAEIFDPDRIVVGIDAKNGMVAINGWTELSSRGALALAAEFAGMGIRRFIYTDISKDGALSGPNFEAVEAFCVNTPGASVIASGGVASSEHVRTLARMARRLPNLEGVIVGKALYEGHVDLAELIQICQESI